MQDVVTPEPIAPVEIATDPEVSAAYDAVHDIWALSISRAGGRMCRWFVTQGADWDFCPPAPDDTPEDGDD